MKILLDIDDTLINRTGEIHLGFKALLDEHEVILFSLNDELGQELSKDYLIPFIDKEVDKPIYADVLIDDCAEFHLRDPKINVQMFCRSINTFLGIV